MECGKISSISSSRRKALGRLVTTPIPAVFTIGKNKNDIDERDTAFGLGFLEGGPVICNHFGKSPEQEKNRVFLERK
jgi:hypothetical protein